MRASAAAPSIRRPMPRPGLDIRQPAVVRSAKVLSLLLVLESLRQTGTHLIVPKV